MNLIKDVEDLSIRIGHLEIRACDVDGNGFVENVDILVHTEHGTGLLMCCNIQTHDEFGALVVELFRVFGKAPPS